MSEPLLQAGAQAEESGLWHTAPIWRGLTVTASLLTLAVVTMPLLVPHAFDTGTALIHTVSATPKIATVQSVNSAPAPLPTHQPVSQPQVTHRPIAQPRPDATPANLPLGTITLQSGVLSKISEHNRHYLGQDLPITITIISPPAHGHVTVQNVVAPKRVSPGVFQNRTMTQVFYQSDPGYAGQDSFTYRRTSPDGADPFAGTFTMNLKVEGASSRPPKTQRGDLATAPTKPISAEK